MNVATILVLATVAYLVIVIVGWLSGTWKRLEVGLIGPVMMLRTGRGRRFIESVSARRRFWDVFGNLSIALTALAMALITIFLLWESFTTFSTPKMIVSPSDINMRLPQSNQLVTGTYLVVGFIVAILIHEFSHGVLSLASKIRLVSIGVLLFVIPIGAFVEPDERVLRASTTARRLRIYSGGPAANVIAAVLCLVVIVGVLGPAAKPVYQGAIVTEATANSPAELFGLKTWSEVISVGGTMIASSSDLDEYWFDAPGTPIVVEKVYGHQLSTIALPSGVAVTQVYDGPAFNAGIKAGEIIASLDDTTIHSDIQLRSVIENASRERPVNITVLKSGPDKGTGSQWFVEDSSIRMLNLTSKWIYYFAHYPDQNKDSYRNISFMGVSTAPFGAETEETSTILDLVARPFHGVHDLEGAVRAGLDFMALPFRGPLPMSSPAADLYAPSGVLGAVPADAYWSAMSLLYWLFWVNLMLALTNALPALPMDGGYVFRETIRATADRWGMRLTGLDRAIGRHPMTDAEINRLTIAASAFFYMVVAYLVAWQIFGPF